MEKRFGTRAGSTIFVLMMLLGAFFVVATDSVAADSEGDYIYTVSGDEATITGYTGAGGAITIPSTLGGYTTVAVGDYAFYYATSLTSVTIPDNVTTIGSYAFSDCTSLASVTLSNNVISIGDYALNHCSLLTSVTIPNSVASIGEGAFFWCISLTSVSIPNTVTNVGDLAFSACTSLTAIDVNTGNMNFASVDGVLFDKTINTLIQCPGGKTGAFTIPNGVNSIGDNAFYACISLTSVTMPISVVYIGNGTFYGCTSMIDVIIGSNVTSIGSEAFNYCTSLASITIPDKVTSIGQGAFYLCESLTSITFLGLTAPTYVGINWIANTHSGITGYAYAASNFPSPGDDFNGLTMGAYLPEDYTYSVSDGNATITGYTGAGGVIVIPSVLGGYETVAIGANAFNNANGHLVTSVTIPDSVTSIGDYAFAYSSTLISVTMPNSVTSIGYGAYAQCTALTSVTIPNSVTSLGTYAFFYCTAMTSVTIGSGVISIGDYAFNQCSALTSVTIPDSVTTIGNAVFAGCSSIISLVIGNSVTSLGFAEFAYCYPLTEVTIPSSVTSIGDSAFLACTSLTSITFLGLVAPTVGVDWITSTPAGIRGHAFTASNFPAPGNDFNGLMMGAAIVEEYTYTVSDGKATITGYTGAGGAIVIPSVLGGYETVAIGNYAFSSQFSLTSVIIPDSVTSIGEQAFYYCTALTSVTIGDSVTSIGNRAFLQCYSLTSVTIPDSVTYISWDAFAYCSALTSVTIPDSVTYIDMEAFQQCTSLTSLTLGSGLTAIGDSAFYNCVSLTSVIIPNSVTSIGDYVFASCSALTSITIGNGVTIIGTFWGGTFFSCTSLTSITFLGLVAPTVGADWILSTPAGIRGHAYAASNFPNPGDSFYGLTMGDVIPEDYTYTVSEGMATITGYTGAGGAITIPSTMSGAYPTVAIGEQAFFYNSAPTSVIIPNSVTSIGDRAFLSCSSMTSVTIPNSVTSIGDGAFAYCYALTSVTIPNSVTSIGVQVFYICTSLVSVTIPDSVTSIGYGAFSQCTALTSVTIPNSVTSIGDWAFFYCTAMTSVTIGSGVISIGEYAFNQCTALTSVTIPDSVTSIGNYVFAGCSSIITLVIGNSVTSLGLAEFYNCISLTSVTIPSSITSIPDSTFYACISLSSVTMPDSVTSIGSYAFASCISLPSVNIPSSVTSIGDYAFNGCSALTSVTIPDSVTYLGDGAFSQCTSLASVTIPNSVTTIAYYMFAYSTSLTSVTIPNSVTSIGDSAFLACSALTSISFLELVAPSIGGINWIQGTPSEIRGHAFTASNFPAPGGLYYGLMMGDFILAAPQAPTELTATPGHVEVFLEWTAPADNGGSAITNYNVYRSDTEMGTYSPIASPSETTYTDTNLTSGQTYWYKVSAVNGIGEGPQCSAVSAIPYTIPNAPIMVNMVAGESSITITWAAPANNGWSPITNYRLYWDTVNPPVANYVTYGPSVFSIEVTGLTAGTTYYMTVTAINAAGESAKPIALRATPQTLPDVPTGLTANAGNAQVSLNWTAPVSSGTSAIDYYVIYQDGIALTDYPTGLTAVIEGLSNGQEYSFTVAAHSLAGQSAQSIAVSSIPMTVPDAPGLSSATSGSSSVTLVWTAPPSDGGSPITGYRVFFGQSDATTQFGDALPATTLTVSVTGLTAGTLYHFAVKAVNAAGSSSSSNVLDATVMTAPGTPTGLHATAIYGQVTLSWNEPSSNGGSAITHYKVYRGLSDTSVVMIGNSTSTTFVDATATAGSTYHYKVSAVNSAGEGIQSASISALVPTMLPISGKIVDDSGNGLAGITVALENGTSVTTDAQGNFTIMASPGNHTLTISGPGIETKSVAVDVTSSGLAIGSIATSKASDLLPIVLAVVVIAVVLLAVLFVVRNRKK